MVRLVDVCKKYPSAQQQVLDHVNLGLGKGEFLYVIGGTGAGKSSLLRLITTEDSPTRGIVSLFGYDLARASSSTVRAIRRSIGFVPQNIGLIGDLTVYENVALSLSVINKRFISADTKARVRELLEKLGLAQKAGVLARNLSGGEGQRVAIARALVRNPQLLIADEPTGAQDKEFIWAIMDIFLRANLSGVTTIVATHDREIVRRVRKKCATLRAGRLALEDALCIY